MTGSLVVLTAAIGPTRDTVKNPVLANGATCICVSDRPLPPASRWMLRAAPTDVPPLIAARRTKILASVPSCDAYLWIDAAFRLDTDPAILLPKLLRHDVLVLKHPERSSIREEAEVLDRRGLADRGDLMAQIDRYRADGYPDDRLSSTGFLLRRRDRRTAAFNDLWWLEFDAAGHTRDQMSFDYCAWKVGLSVGYLEGHYQANPYATWVKDR